MRSSSCAEMNLTFAEPHKTYPEFPCLMKDHRSTACGFCVRSIWLLAHVACVSATGLKQNSQTYSGCCLGWEGSHFLCVLAGTGLGVYAQKLYRSHAWCWLWRCLALGATPCLLENPHEIAKNSELLHFSFKWSLRCELRVRKQFRTGHCSLHSQLNPCMKNNLKIHYSVWRGSKNEERTAADRWLKSNKSLDLSP